MWQSKREISRECNDIIGSAKGSQISETYCCFINYVKAFESVSHFKLWLKLAKCGVTGKLLNLCTPS